MTKANKKKSRQLVREAQPATKAIPAAEARRETTRYPIRLTGTITFLVENDEWFQQVKILNAIFRSEREIVFDCDCGPAGSPFIYTVALYRTDETLFEGQFTGGKNEDRATGTALCRLYTNKHGYALAGIWTEAGGRDEWFAELFPLRSAHRPTV